MNYYLCPGDTLVRKALTDDIAPRVWKEREPNKERMLDSSSIVCPSGQLLVVAAEGRDTSSGVLLLLPNSLGLAWIWTWHARDYFNLYRAGTLVSTARNPSGSPWVIDGTASRK